MDNIKQRLITNRDHNKLIKTYINSRNYLKLPAMLCILIDKAREDWKVKVRFTTNLTLTSFYYQSLINYQTYPMS